MNIRLTACFLTIFSLTACAEGPIFPGDRDVPRPNAFAPSIADERRARANGEQLSAEEARQRVDEFRVTSDSQLREWPVDTITYKRFQNPGQRAIYLRRALGRYALIKAKERSTGVALQRVRRASSIAAPSTAGEWWAGSIHRADLTLTEANRAVSLPEVVYDAVRYSNQIAAFGDLPAIRGTAIQEARGRFVPEFFAEVSISRENERATSPAIAAGAARSITEEEEAEFGVRSRLITGGEIALSQNFTRTDTNRTAFIPGRQTSAQTRVSLVQPLLRGSGVTYNDGPRRIANMDTQIATEEFRRQSEAHLLEVERAYWNLYLARAIFLQKSHLAGHGERLANQVSRRVEIDADPIIVNNAKSLALQWRADAVRAKSAVDNAEFRLQALVNSPALTKASIELLPTSAPNGSSRILSTEDTLDQIFQNRPELQQAILQYEAALLREGLAANESLPELDLILEYTGSGGTDGGSFAGAFDDEDNGAGHLVGLKFSVPLGFDERDARYKRRRLETIQQERQVLAVISTILAEVDVSANEYIISTQDLYARRQAQLAAQRDLVTLRDRWNDGVGEGQSIAIFSALLDAYERVQLSEEAVATARATREISAANLARARGVLLARWGLQTEIRNEIRNEPTYKLTKQN